MTDVRPFSPTPMDLALVRRLASRQLSMDTVLALTRGGNPLEAALLAFVPLADLGLPTLVMREGEEGLIGQIRHRMGEKMAYIACLAPAPHDNDLSYIPWLQLLDGLVTTAGRRGAWIITAEVLEKETAAIKLLRMAGFMVYSRQTLYRRLPGPVGAVEPLERLRLRLAHAMDYPRAHALHASLVPTLVQQADPLPENGASSLVVESVGDNRLLGYLALIEGKAGLMVKPYLHPDVYEEAATILACALRFWPKAERLPVYFCIRSHQEWLRLALASLEIEAGDRQAVFVKHTTARAENGLEHARSALEKAFGSLAGTAEVTIEQS